MAPLDLDSHLLAMLRVLDEHRVEHVLVGQFAAAVHSGGGSIDGIAIVPSGYARNVDRLIAALHHLEARLTGAFEGPLPIETDADGLRALSPCTLTTREGKIRVDFEPVGTSGYRELYFEARPARLAADLAPLVTSPEDLDRIGGSVPRRRGSEEISARRLTGRVSPASAPRASTNGDPPGARARAAARRR